MPTPTPLQSTTQQFLDIYDVSNDVVILKNGATSIILTVNAINFGLLAEEEQDAVMYQYAALLNSLNFPIQVVVVSQTKDASVYLQLLKDREDQTTERIKRDWIKRYREFVGNLIYERNVLDKKFYVVIPASYLEMGLTTAQNLLSSFRESTIEHVEKSVILEKGLTILEPRRDHLISQFGRIGLVARQLKTQEIIQLFYTSYNPEAAEGQQITDSQSYTTPLVQAQIRGVLMNDQPTGSLPSTQPAPADPMTTPPQTPPGQPPVSQPASAPAPMPPTPVMPQPTPMPTAIPTPTAPTMSSPTPVSSSTPTSAANPMIIESPVTTPPVASTTSTIPTPMPSIPPASVMPQPTPMPAAMPMPTSPTPITPAPTPTMVAKPDPEMQAVIDSTLKELASAPASAPATTPPTITEEPPAPDLASVEPVTPIKPS